MSLPHHFDRALGLHRKSGPVTSLHIFDFDGTLVRTPGPDEGKARYKSATGKDWSGGWWGKPGSLAAPVISYPIPQSMVIRTVFNTLEDVVTRSQSSIGVVITGRIRPVRTNVLRVLDNVCIQAGNETVRSGESFLHHNAVITHPGGRLHTLEFKTKTIKKIVSSDPVKRCPIRDIHIWEDREDHAQYFSTRLKDDLWQIGHFNTIVHLVTPQMQ